MRMSAAVLAIVALIAATYVGERIDAVSAATGLGTYAEGSILMGSIHVDDPGIAALDPGVMDLGAALDRAASAAGPLADRSKPYSAQLASMTNDTYGPVDGEGNVEKVVDHRLSWLVRFSGTQQPIYGGYIPGVGAMADSINPATEINVVIDAKTGEVLLMFSFQ